MALELCYLFKLYFTATASRLQICFKCAFKIVIINYYYYYYYKLLLLSLSLIIVFFYIVIVLSFLFLFVFHSGVKWYYY